MARTRKRRMMNQINVVPYIDGNSADDKPRGR